VDVVAAHPAQALGEDRVEPGARGAVVETAGGSAGSSPRSTCTLWPWLARIRVPVESNEKRRLSLRATNSCSSSPDTANEWAAQAESNASTSTQPPGPSSRPSRAGS
jgi:hypothetical protein